MKYLFIVLLYSFALPCLTQTPCPVTATAHANGTIIIHNPNQALTVYQECVDQTNNSFINRIMHVGCSNLASAPEYVLMITDVGKIYHFQLPYQNVAYFQQWCGHMNLSDWYHQIKHDPTWRHMSYQINCSKVLSTGVTCSRLSEQSYCWQHR